MGVLREGLAYMTWVGIEAKYFWQEFRRSRIKQIAFSDAFQAAVFVSNPKFGFLPEEIDQIIQNAANREISQLPTTREDVTNIAMTAAYTRYR